jgi:NAD(P)-dependent dehydrogenase (short-subunit alcohol dehydrogenase family)
MAELEGKVALVTGAARGLGESVLRTLCRHGAHVVGADIREALLAEVVAETKQSGGRAEGLPMDVTVDRDVERVLGSVLERHGRLDILVNNAAVDHTLPVEDLSVPQFDQILDTNLRGAFLMCQRAVPTLKRQGHGTIVNVISTAGLRVWPNASAYHASKWGLLGFTHALNREMREHNVRVTALVSGGMRTPFITERFPGIDVDTLQDPQLVADALLFAVSLPPSTHIPELVISPMRDMSFP